jgi:hypothetical protein
VDTGDFIAREVAELCADAEGCPVVIDMGCGSAWLARALQNVAPEASYIGLDNDPGFIRAGQDEFADRPNITFLKKDVERPDPSLNGVADVVVNAFNFFELPSLHDAMAAATEWMKPTGTMLVSSIDVTYLLIALSEGWSDFHRNLKLFQELPGVKYAFQRVDLGESLSSDLEYPSVLYPLEDFYEAAKGAGLLVRKLQQCIFTAKPVPKIYFHLWLTKRD